MMRTPSGERRAIAVRERPRLERIVVTGVESTGKSTLALQLAEALGGERVREYARRYAAEVKRPLTAADVEAIALGQIEAEDEALACCVTRDADADDAPRVLVLDTDLVSTTVYAEHYYGTSPEWVLRSARERLAGLYLLCTVDLPWEPDGVRDQPHTRVQLHERLAARLQELGATVMPVWGRGEERLARALAAVRGWRAARAGAAR